METVEGLEIGEEMDVRHVIWQYRGAPYKAQILEIHGEQWQYYYIDTLLLLLVLFLKTKT